MITPEMARDIAEWIQRNYGLISVAADMRDLAQQVEDLQRNQWVGKDATIDRLTKQVEDLQAELAKYKPFNVLGYGCHCDLGPDDKPDGCVFDSGDIDDCVNAIFLKRAGKGKTDCESWQPIRIVK